MRRIVWLMVVISSIWVLIDAKRIGVREGLIKGIANMNPWAWFFACLLLWIVSFPVYLVKRPEFIRAQTAPTPIDDD